MNYVMGAPLDINNQCLIYRQKNWHRDGGIIYNNAVSHSWKTIVDLRINETLQTGAVFNRTYRGVKVSIYFLNLP